MKIVLGLFCIFTFILAMGAAPVVDNGHKNARQDDLKDDKETDDIVREKTRTNFSFYSFNCLFSWTILNTDGI